MATSKDQSKGKLILALEKKLQNSKLTPNTQKKIVVISDILYNIILVVVIVALIRTFIMSPFQVYGISMCNTLNYINDQCVDSYGDYIIINKFIYQHIPGIYNGDPQRGDIIVFRPPQNQQEYFIKRVIGLPGDTIKLVDGYVYLFNKEFPDGKKLEEDYLSAENFGNTFATGGIDQFTVPEGEYFVLGDNRKRSSDSRMCFKESSGSPNCGEKGATPYLTPQEIEGKASVVLWPHPRLITGHQYLELESENN